LIAELGQFRVQRLDPSALAMCGKRDVGP